MKASKEEMKKEALERIKILGLLENVYNEFEQNDILNVSYYGALYYPTEKQKQRIEEFEKESGNLVYHVIDNMTSIGELLTFLYVSKHKQEWNFDKQELLNGTPIAYVANVSDEICSEYGSIGIKPWMGGLLRTD